MDWTAKNKKTPSEIMANKGFAKNKIISRGKSSKALFVVLFLANVFLFFPRENAFAAAQQAGCQYQYKDGLNQKMDFLNEDNANGITEVTCCDKAKEKMTASSASKMFLNCIFIDANGNKDVAGTPGHAGGANNNGVVPSVKAATPSMSDMFVTAIKTLLVFVLNLTGFIFSIATTLFVWIVDPVNVSGANGMLNKQAVKDVWIMVRDLLNMTFILILLFAAFCTIFQVEKWNLKKVWLNILINALLVNFSFPIARFIIDISNVAFYYFVTHLFAPPAGGVVSSGGIFAMFGAASGIGEILKPENYTNFDISYLIAMIVVLFIMGMTLLIIAALFVVRLIALTMIVMFSPVGFVGYIFPATSGYADKWWKNLFSYSFFAPIMIFIMAISLRITQAMGQENMAAFKASASAQAPVDQSNWIARMAFLSIPIIILWMGMGIAKSFGIAGADTVVGAVKKGGKWLANAPGHYSGVYGGTKKGFENMRKSGKFLGMENWATKLAFKSGVADREARIAGGLEGGVKGWKSAVEKKQAKEFNEKVNEQKDSHVGLSNKELVDGINRDVTPKNALEIAAMHRHMMSDSGRISEFENEIKNDVRGSAQHQAKMIGLSDPEREVYLKNEVANAFGKARNQAQKAKEMYTTGKIKAKDFEPRKYNPPAPSLAPAQAPPAPTPTPQAPQPTPNRTTPQRNPNANPAVRGAGFRQRP